MPEIEVTTAKNCGFCFGVRKAVDTLVYEIEQNKPKGARVYLLGEIIHNNSFIKEMTKKSEGMLTVIESGEFSDDTFEKDSTVVIRAHGITKADFERLLEISVRKSLKIADATCECVKKMHKIAEKNTGEETLTLIFGDRNHPEIVGLKSYVKGECIIYRDFEELESDRELFGKNEKTEKKLIIMAQTTHSVKDYASSRDYILKKNSSTETVFFETVCGETAKRQTEAELLSKESDIMVVVGSKTSSNTKKLYEICKKNCENSFIVETSEQLSLDILKNLIGDAAFYKGGNTLKVSITAGASTPDSIIMEVKKIMADTINNGETVSETQERVVESVDLDANATGSGSDDGGEENFAELLDRTFATLNRGDRVKGTISYISDGEIHVDVGFKYTGILTFDEVTDDSSVDLKEMFKVGDEIETQIIKTNDQEGIALLSKKRVDSTEVWDKIVKLHEEGTIVDGKVIQVVNGGIIVLVDSMKVFVPASHADVSRETDLQTLVGKSVKVKIIDINAVKRRAIASIRNASAEARKAVEEKIWGEIEINKRYEGVVKSIANYGVFVDIGGIDGMIHITELSWSRIKHPSEVLQLGEKIEVYIKDFDREKRRIALGYKDENENPWIKCIAEIKVGDVVEAKILNMMPFGAFAEIFPGVDGLIHISQIVDKKISKPSEVLNIGDVVQVKITDIDSGAKKISLSMRALLEGPEAAEETAGETTENAEKAEETAE